MSGAGASHEQIALERFSELWAFETAPPDIFEFAVAYPGLTPGDKAALCGHDQNPPLAGRCSAPGRDLPRQISRRRRGEIAQAPVDRG